MRTLNRPMFNMGGPIKQGIMHGIREPYRGGQLVQPGPGRPGYAGPPKSKLGIAGWLAKKVPFLKQPVKTISKSTKDIIPKTWGKIKNIYKGDTKAKGYVPPGVATNRWYWEKGIKPTGALIGTGVKKAIPYAGTAGAIGGLTYGFWPDGTPKDTTELIEDNVVVQKGKDYGPHTKGGPTITQSIKDKWATEAKDKRVNNLLEIMGYDKAKKNAAYDALIDAGRIINERGTLEAKNINRELIDPIIGAASKRFDKPQDIREAVGLLMAKGEIEKDVSASKGSTTMQTAKDMVATGASKDLQSAMKTLTKQSTMADTLGAIVAKGGSVGADEVEIALRIENPDIIPKKKIRSSNEDYKKWKEKNKKKTEMDFMTEIVSKGSDFGPGVYIIDKRAIVVDGQGNMAYEW